MEKMFAETYSGLLITRTLANLNLALTGTKIDFPWISNFCFPLGHFLYYFTLDNSKHVLSP